MVKGDIKQETVTCVWLVILIYFLVFLPKYLLVFTFTDYFIKTDSILLDGKNAENRTQTPICTITALLKARTLVF